MQIKFSQLLTKAIIDQKTQYITRLPKVMLSEVEKKYVGTLEKCLGEGWIPTLDTFRSIHKFLPMESEIPIDVMYENFSSQRRDEYIALQTKEFIEKNSAEGKEPYEGMATFQFDLLEKTAISNPKIIDYGSLPRESYVKNVYRSQFHLPYFDQMTNGLQGGDFIVFMAGTKGFKTTLLKAAAYGSYRKGKEDVLIASQEQSPAAMSAQMDMQALHRTHSELRAGISEERMAELKKHEGRVRHLENKLFITPQVKSVRQLHEYIISLNRPIKKVFIDGLNLMQGDSTDSYGSLLQVCSDLKSYAIDKELIVVAVTQSNREGFKQSLNMGAQHIAGSFGIAMYADLMVALSTIMEKNKPIVYARPILNRHGDLNTKVAISVDYDKSGRFGLDFGLLDPDYNPDEAVISYSMRNVLKANFKAETGLEWEEVVSTLGEDAANELLSSSVSNPDLDQYVENELKSVKGAF